MRQRCIRNINGFVPAASQHRCQVLGWLATSPMAQSRQLAVTQLAGQPPPRATNKPAEAARKLRPRNQIVQNRVSGHPDHGVAVVIGSDLDPRRQAPVRIELELFGTVRSLLPSKRPRLLRLHAPYRSSHRTRFFCVAETVLRPHVTRASVSRRFVFIEMTSDSAPAPDGSRAVIRAYRTCRRTRALSHVRPHRRFRAAVVAKLMAAALIRRGRSSVTGASANRCAKPDHHQRRGDLSSQPAHHHVPLSRKRPRRGRRPSRFANVSILQPPARHRTCSRCRAAPSNRCWRRCRPRHRWSERCDYRYRGRSSGIRPCRSGCR